MRCRRSPVPQGGPRLGPPAAPQQPRCPPSWPDGGHGRNPVVLVGAQQAAEATDELLVLLAEEWGWMVPVEKAQLGLRVPWELQGFDHLRQETLGGELL